MLIVALPDDEHIDIFDDDNDDGDTDAAKREELALECMEAEADVK